MEIPNQNSEINNVNEDKNHPLSRSWTLWYDPPLKSKAKELAWENRLKKIGTFSSVEEFWGLLSFIYLFQYL